MHEISPPIIAFHVEVLRVHVHHAQHSPPLMIADTSLTRDGLIIRHALYIQRSE